MKRKIILFIAIIFSLIFARMIFSYFAQKNDREKKKSLMTPSVTVERILTRKVTREYNANARIVSKYRVDILARIEGYLIKSYFKEGDIVKAGQVLFEIEPQQYQYAASQAKADLANATSQYTYYQKQLKRYDELVKHDYIARSDFDSMLSQRDSYHAQVQRAKSVLKDAQRNLGYTHIKSPVSGRVGLISVTVGNYVTPSVGALTTINSNEPMYITFPLDANIYEDLVRIDGANANRKVEFTFNSGKKYEYDGVQDFRDNQIDISAGTITMRATFKNPKDELIQGDFGRITIFSNKKDDLPIISQTSTAENQVGRYVYVLDKDNLPRLVYIKTLKQTEDGYWIVTDGLKAGDVVVAKGLQKVTPGQPVKIVDESKYKDTDNGKKEGLFTKFKKLISKCFKVNK